MLFSSSTDLLSCEVKKKPSCAAHGHPEAVIGEPEVTAGASDL